MKKKTVYTEVAYLLGLVFIALGAALMERSDFGVSMIVAPAYLLFRYVSTFWPWFTFGTAEYCFQAVLLLLMMLVMRRFRLPYLFSFVTAVLYGFILDGCMLLAALLPNGLVWRFLWFILGMLAGALGVSLMFRTYLPAEVYELFVKEVSGHTGINITKFKTWYDRVSCLIALAMSFLFFGLWHFVGVNWGTIFCALINGPSVGQFGVLLDSRFCFKDALPWRSFFTEKPAEKT